MFAESLIDRWAGLMGRDWGYCPRWRRPCDSDRLLCSAVYSLKIRDTGGPSWRIEMSQPFAQPLSSCESQNESVFSYSLTRPIRDDLPRLMRTNNTATREPDRRQLFLNVTSNCTKWTQSADSFTCLGEFWNAKSGLNKRTGLERKAWWKQEIVKLKKNTHSQKNSILSRKKTQNWLSRKLKTDSRVYGEPPDTGDRRLGWNNRNRILDNLLPRQSAVINSDTCSTPGGGSRMS